MTEDIENMLAEIRDALERIANAMEQEKTTAPAITLDDYNQP